MTNIDDLTNFNNRLFQFTKKLITSNHNKNEYFTNVKKYKQLREDYNNLISNFQNGGNVNEIELLEIITPKDDDKLILRDESNFNMSFENENLDLLDTENNFLDDEKMIGGYDFSNNKTNKKQVSFSTFNDNNNNSSSISKNDKLFRKLNTMWAEQVINIGKSLSFKPQKNKKFLSKTEVINKIMNNPNLHNQVMKEINNFELLQSETNSEY